MHTDSLLTPNPLCVEFLCHYTFLFVSFKFLLSRKMSPSQSQLTRSVYGLSLSQYREVEIQFGSHAL